MSYIYLACPYTHDAENIREDRFRKANQAAAMLMREGYAVFSPISHSHPISPWVGRGNATDAAFWKKQDLPLLQHASKLVVLCLEGWEGSVGIQWEIEMAKQLNLPVKYMYPEISEEYNMYNSPYRKYNE